MSVFELHANFVVTLRRFGITVTEQRRRLEVQ